MHLQVISPGKTRQDFIRQGELFYLKKISHYLPVEMIMVKEEPLHEGKNDLAAMEKESSRIIEKLDPSQQSILVLERQGKPISSLELAALLRQKMNHGTKKMVFVVGGTLGCSKTLQAKAHHLISLSGMTFTHELSRLILLEQIYRAMTIIKGEKYHK
jgi:23S rRNA (pseudouridine1915-N3)-methyltransferase